MYYLLLIFLFPLSLLPLPVLYRLSDLAYFLLFRVMGYRKEVVRKNLAQAFPEKEEKELEMVMRGFYRSFCDQWIETLKLLSISLARLDRKFDGNFEVLDQLYDEGKNVYALLGHQFNWEWGNVVTQMNSKAQFAGIYLPQDASSFDRIMLQIRKRSGSIMIPANEMRSSFLKLKSKRHIIGFMADQTPANLAIADWYVFMNRPAPFFKAPEKSARRAKAAVVFVAIKKRSRGRYRLTFSKICDDASQLAAGEITGRYVAFMERQLREQPENWMWTHRRWKREMPSDAVLRDTIS